ncbi:MULTISPECIES: MerR family transcriptional regulator [Gammaproteobacteria]|uniref:MerR family transcriptional regulator n=2 Tax=Pseudomonadota TaxID=1224 RepID=UPI0016593C45|nr:MULTISPECIES: MerR family transcriptional regulator [Gammaproteobacteria]MCD9354722.1 MerR family transcriptional regulator [Klebsiella pneumoniae]MCD9415396.1 MerR family transcriptional regulator [Klebsiella pneumoniae]MCD9608982.1 MerR family transcriptional regulator [Raoultella planticola]MDE9664884.1 MerR family transcriptional regulator [Citrobacter portucalensis]MDE9674524.1 MerR family transcriptional regulator [Citrobacter portucalensis]
MKIGELAKTTSTTTETIRFYERQGLLKAPGRGKNNYRHYDPEHVTYLNWIRMCRALEMSIDDIREILCLVSEPNRAGDAANARICKHLFDLDVRVAHLMELKTSLLDLRRSLMQPSLQEHTATSLVTGGRFSKAIQ